MSRVPHVTIAGDQSHNLLRLVVRLVVAIYDWSCDQSWVSMTYRAIHRRPQRQVVRLSATRLATDIFEFNTILRCVVPAVVQPPQKQSQSIVYPKKYAHGFVVLCFVVVMQSFIMNSHEVFIHIHQGCFAGTGAIVRLPQCQWSKPDGYGKISQCITTTKHSKAKTVCIFLGIYCTVVENSGE